MRLAYMWIENYRNIFIEQEFRFSNQLTVSKRITRDVTSGVNVELKIERSTTALSGVDFYGGKVLDAAAIVGKNGTGKTSLIHMLLETMPNIIQMNESLDLFNYENEEREQINKLPGALFQIFISDEKDKFNIYVYSHNITILNREKLAEVAFLNSNDFQEKLCFLAITNVFNWTELFSKSYETFEGDYLIQKYISPASLLKNSSEEYKKSFGYRTKQNNYLTSIQELAIDKSKNALQYYLNMEQRVLLDFMLNVNSEIKKELNISEFYDINFVDFDSDLPIEYYWDSTKHQWNSDRIKNLSAYDQLRLDAHRIYILLKNKIEKNKDRFALNIYIQLLTEIYFSASGRNGNQILEEISSLANDTKKCDIDSVDYVLLERLCGLLKETFHFENVSEVGGWLEQIFNCVEQLSTLEQKEWVLKKRRFDWQSKENLVGGEDSEFIKWFIEQFEDNAFFTRNIHISHSPLSSGETAFIHLMSYLLLELRKVKQGSTVFLMIDEVDAYLHPDWQKKIMNLLISFLNTIEDYKFQLLVTSHSPIILSDFCKNQIIRLDREGISCESTLQEEASFGANISILYTDSFFMKDGLIGEFAKKQIQTTIDKLNKGNADSKLKYMIDNIGDEFVRKSLQARYEENAGIDFSNIIESCTLEEKEKVKELIQNMRKDKKVID